MTQCLSTDFMRYKRDFKKSFKIGWLWEIFVIICYSAEHVNRTRHAQRAAVCWKRRLDAHVKPPTKETLVCRIINDFYLSLWRLITARNWDKNEDLPMIFLAKVNENELNARVEPCGTFVLTPKDCIVFCGGIFYFSTNTRRFELIIKILI